MRQSEYPEVTLLTRCVFGYGLHVEDLRCRSGELIPDNFTGYSGGKETNSLRSLVLATQSSNIQFQIRTDSYSVGFTKDESASRSRWINRHQDAEPDGPRELDRHPQEKKSCVQSSSHIAERLE